MLDFVYLELIQGLQKGYVPKRRANYGRWFLQLPGTAYAYCDGPALDWRVGPAGRWSLR